MARTRWSAARAAQYTFLNALRDVLGLLPLVEPPPDEDERRAQQHAAYKDPKPHWIPEHFAKR